MNENCAAEALGDEGWMSEQLEKLHSANLVELHAHLLGMGSADFWIRIITDCRMMPPNSTFICSPDWGDDPGRTRDEYARCTALRCVCPESLDRGCSCRTIGSRLRIRQGPLLFWPFNGSRKFTLASPTPPGFLNRALSSLLFDHMRFPDNRELMHTILSYAREILTPIVSRPHLEEVRYSKVCVACLRARASSFFLYVFIDNF